MRLCGQLSPFVNRTPSWNSGSYPLFLWWLFEYQLMAVTEVNVFVRAKGSTAALRCGIQNELF